MTRSILLVLAVTSVIAQGVKPAATTLADLTVTTGLPENCALAEAMTQPINIGRTLADVMVTSNPWIGADRRIVAAIYENIYGAAKVPDANPLSQGSLVRFLLQLAEGVDEGYIAAYGEKGSKTFVYGLRFSSSSRPPERPTLSDGWTLEFVRVDHVVAAVKGYQSDCSDVVRAHVRSVGERP